MSDLKAMMARWARPGVVGWIGVRPERRARMVAVQRGTIEAGGLVGDHARAGKRAVTLMQAEHLDVIGACLGRGAVDPELLRRNILVRGINLAALKDRQVAVGGAVLHLTTICAPCSRMEETFGAGGYSAVRGHGGWCAHVVRPGDVALGDTVHPVD